MANLEVSLAEEMIGDNEDVNVDNNDPSSRIITKAGRYPASDQSAILKHFTVDDDKKTSACKHCKHIAKGKLYKHTSNLNKHLSMVHKSIAIKVKEETEKKWPASVVIK